MRIHQGLFEGIVLQRTAANVSDVVFRGASHDRGDVKATVSTGHCVLPGFEDLVVGQARDGKLEGRLTGIPAGGPYQITLRIGDTQPLIIPDVYVGDLWILGGQSNMQGCALRASALSAQPQVRAFYMDDRWAPACDPLHNLWDAVDPVHEIVFNVKPVETPDRGVGPGVAFGQAMHELTGVPQGLIACAHGGTSMSQWNPALKRHGSRSLYGAMLRRMQINGGRVAGIVWYQGCSDANSENAPLYTKRMKRLIAAFRRDSKDENLPFVAVQIAGVYSTAFDSASWNSVQVQQQRLQNTVKHCSVVPAIDLEFDDTIHLDGPSQHRLGRRLAHAMHALKENDSQRGCGITMKKVTTRPNRVLGSMDIIIEFDRVVGSLRSAGKPSGFSLESIAGESMIYKTEIAGRKVILHSSMQMWDIDHKELWHGHGVTPYCNITDEEDRPLPVFGPVLIGKLRAMTPFVQTLRVSPALPLVGALENQALPSPNLLHTRTFTEVNRFLNIYPAWQGSTTPQFLWFACRFSCIEEMILSLSIGYDGPVAAWIDGAPVYADPTGVNPAVADEKMIPFTAPPGEHEALIALSSNANRAWGIYLRFERRGLSAKRIEAGNYALPIILENDEAFVTA